MGKKVVGLFVVAVALLLAVPQAFAKEDYGTAGCGLGSLLFGGGETKFKQVMAATTNGTFGSQTFGISSGTSNCDLSNASHASLRTYIETNQLALANDVARGQGETLNGLAKILECQNTGALGSTLQSNYQSIFPSEKVSSTAVSQSILDTIQGNKVLTASCGLI